MHPFDLILVVRHGYDEYQYLDGTDNWTNNKDQAGPYGSARAFMMPQIMVPMFILDFPTVERF